MNNEQQKRVEEIAIRFAKYLSDRYIPDAAFLLDLLREQQAEVEASIDNLKSCAALERGVRKQISKKDLQLNRAEAKLANASYAGHYISSACQNGLHEHCRKVDKWNGDPCLCPCGHGGILASPTYEAMQAELERETAVRKTAESEAHNHAIRTAELYIEREELQDELEALRKDLLSIRSGMIADSIVLSVAEIPDRFSPEDQPDMMLITPNELRSIVMATLEDLLPKVIEQRASGAARATSEPEK